MRRRRTQDLNSYIDKLPDEILALIFSWYSCRIWCPPVRLSVICKRWCAVIMSAPAAWAFYTIKDQKLSIPHELLWKNLSRSEQTPLSIRIVGNASHTAGAYSRLHLLFAHSHRITTLYCLSQTDWLTDTMVSFPKLEMLVLRNLVKEESNQDIPLLYTRGEHSNTDSSDEEECGTDAGRRMVSSKCLSVPNHPMPNLRILEIIDPYDRIPFQMGPSFPLLLHLKLVGTNTIDIIPLITHCAGSLKTLQVGDGFRFEPAPDILLPELVGLSIRRYNLFKCSLITPSLRIFKEACSFDGEGAVRRGEQIRFWMCCRNGLLRRFGLWDTEDRPMVEMEAYPNIELLIVQDDRSYILQLIEYLLENESVWPRLKTMVISIEWRFDSQPKRRDLERFNALACQLKRGDRAVAIDIRCNERHHEYVVQGSPTDPNVMFDLDLYEI